MELTGAGIIKCQTVKINMREKKPLVTADRKLFEMMPHIIIIKVRKLHLPTLNYFSTVRNRRLNRINPKSTGFFLLVQH